MFDDFNGLKVTEIRIKLADEKGNDRLRAYATVGLNGAFVIQNVTVIEAFDGRMFASMPAKRKSDGSHMDVFHPISREARDWIEGIILREYQRELEIAADWDAATAPGLKAAS